MLTVVVALAFVVAVIELLLVALVIVGLVRAWRAGNADIAADAVVDAELRAMCEAGS